MTENVAPSEVRRSKEPAAVTLDRVRRSLAYGAGDDGLRLWSMRWLGRSCRALLLSALSAEDGPALPALVRDAADTLIELDETPWTERLPAVRRALQLVEQALVGENLPSHELMPRAELVRLQEMPEADRAERKPRPEAPPPRPAKGAAAPPPPAAPKVAAPPPPPPRPSLPLGHPNGTGKAIEGPEAAVAAFAEAGITTLAELLTRLPVDHQRFTALRAEDPLPDGGEVAVSGQLGIAYHRFGPAGRCVERVLARGASRLICRWYAGAPADLGAAGAEITLVGTLDVDGDEPVLREPLRWFSDGKGTVRRPVYGIAGVSDTEVQRRVRAALVEHADFLVDPMPSSVLQEARVLGLKDALWEQHLPSAGLNRGRARAVFEELFLNQVSAASRQTVRLKGIAHPISHELCSRIELQFGFHLNDAQELVLDEVKRDLRRGTAMTRLLQGDVGSGKSLVALLAALVVLESKSQVLFVAPDAIAAEHRFLFAAPMLKAAGLVPQLLTEKPSAGQLDALRRGEVHAVFATRRLLDELPEFKKLGLVIAEERGTYGLISREKLARNGVNPDLLVVTAVPIPTSLTFTIFSDYDLSVVATEQAQHVEIRVRGPEGSTEAYQALREQMTLGRQAYLAFPMSNGRDLVPLPKAQMLTKALEEEAFKGFRIALYHGEMSAGERAKILENFQHLRLDLLVCMTAIEDAPEVANATAMVVEGADGYDLVRLHRLRGHVAQGRQMGLCYLVLNPEPDPEGRRRVELIAREQDGFQVAEQDRIARGDEALLGDRAAELPKFKVADPLQDRDLLLRARRAAFILLKADPQFKQRAHRDLARLIDPRLVEARPQSAPARPEGGRPEGAPPAAESSADAARRKRRRRRKK